MNCSLFFFLLSADDYLNFRPLIPLIDLIGSQWGKGLPLFSGGANFQLPDFNFNFNLQSSLPSLQSSLVLFDLSPQLR